ncbi:RadC family protein [Croceiramulus getboli]|nr:DNA repair protein RadC [Flavobacteriaceae bacterium YJPT1-3]
MKSLSIKEWSLGDRPREKLVEQGRKALSDAELLAILLGSGSKNESAVRLSKRILAHANNRLSELGKMSLVDLMRFRGIGEAKAVTVSAALELGRRHRAEGVLEKKKITSSAMVFEYLLPWLSDLPHEEFRILYLNNANRILKHTQLSKGGMTGTLVDVRLVLKEALALGATGIILAHNHPSGTLQPSESDKSLTQKLHLAAGSLDIKVLDHLIVGEKAYFSFADEGLL